MKIRTDFVTNSSSSSFTCLRFDNPVLQQLFIDHNIKVDPLWGGLLSNPPATQNDILCHLVEQINKPAFTDAVNQNRDRINASFQRLEWGDGYDNWEGMPAGHEKIVSGSSRWGLYSQEAWFDEENLDKYDCDYAYECWAVDNGNLSLPTEEDSLLFANARPEDLAHKDNLSEKMQYVLQHLDKNPVDLEEKMFVLNIHHPFDREYYGSVRVDEAFEENNNEDSIVEFSSAERPNHLISCLPDAIRIDQWLTCFNSCVTSIDSIKYAAYYVIRLDEWAEKYIDLEVLQRAVAANVRIISEHQLWRAIFVEHKSQLTPEIVEKALHVYKVDEYGEGVHDELCSENMDNEDYERNDDDEDAYHFYVRWGEKTLKVVVPRNEEAIAEKKARYSELREKYLKLVQTISFYTGKGTYRNSIISLQTYDHQNVPTFARLSVRQQLWSETKAYFDYLILDDKPLPVADELRANEITTLSEWLDKTLNILPKKLKEAAKNKASVVRKVDFQNDLADCLNALNKEEEEKYASFLESIPIWEAGIPFDHLSEFSCEGKVFVAIGLADAVPLGKMLFNYRKIKKKNYSYLQMNCKPTSRWIADNGGLITSDLESADYLIVGMHANAEDPRIAKAIQYRDSGKTQIKIVAEDELLWILDGGLEALRKAKEKQHKLEQKQREAEERKRITEERKRIVAEEKQRIAEERYQRRATLQAEHEALKKAATELAQQQRQEKLEKQAAEKAAKEEKRRAEEEERQRKLQTDVLYRPGEEPANVRKRIDNLFAKLDEAYPDKQISSLQKDHKKWAETVTELYRLLGYPDNRSFLEAYGYTVEQGENKGGRPTTVDPEAVIAELKRRYPNGGVKSTSQLQKDNSDLPIKTLINNAQKLFGMSLKDYLTQIGVLP